MGCSNSKQEAQNPNSKLEKFQRNGYFKSGVTDIQQAKNYFQTFLDNGEQAQFVDDQKCEQLISQDYEWGKKLPLENVVTSVADLNQLSKNKALFQNSLHIVEPWENVGYNSRNEPVRASKNIQYIGQTIADVDSICYPLWQFGKVLMADQIVQSLKGGFVCLFEGGFPDPYDQKTFTHPDCPREYLFEVYKKVILNAQELRRCIFICLSHQLLITTIVELIKDFVDQANSDNSGSEISNYMKEIATYIDEVGAGIGIKKNGKIEFSGYRHDCFSTWKNEITEAQQLKLYKYKIPQSQEGWVPEEVINSNKNHADKNMGVIEKMLENSDDIKISMFHSSEVNHESVLFGSWALSYIREKISEKSELIRGDSNWKWVFDLPVGIEIICCTQDQTGQMVTEAACYRVDYESLENKGDIKHYYSCQFHPELFEDLSDFSTGKFRPYKELQQESGVQMLVRMMIAHR